MLRTSSKKQKKSAGFARLRLLAVAVIAVCLIAAVANSAEISSWVAGNVVLSAILKALSQPAPLTAVITLLFGYFAVYPEIHKYKKNAEISYTIEKVRSTEMLAYRLMPLLLDSAYLLSRQVEKLLRCESEEYQALSHDFIPGRSANWSMTHRYQLNHTLYLFAQYFALVKTLRREIFCSHYLYSQEQNYINNCILNCIRALGNYYRTGLPSPVYANERDVQVYSLYQDAIGDAVIKNEDDLSFISFIEFEENIDNPYCQKYFSALTDLLFDLRPDEYRWHRLLSFLYHLNKLRDDVTFISSKIRNRLLDLDSRSYEFDRRDKKDMLEMISRRIQDSEIDYNSIVGSENHKKPCPYGCISLDDAVKTAPAAGKNKI